MNANSGIFSTLRIAEVIAMAIKINEPTSHARRSVSNVWCRFAQSSYFPDPFSVSSRDSSLYRTSGATIAMTAGTAQHRTTKAVLSAA